MPASEAERSTELALILALAREADDAALAASAPRVDFGRMADELARLRVLALLGGRVLERADVVSPPDSFRERVEACVEASRSDALLQQMLTWRLLQGLAADGVQAMPLKGPYLAERLHGDPALRSSADIDLLVRARDLPSAIGSLERLGYARPRRSEQLPRLHHIFEAQGAPPVELHWRVSWYETRYADEAIDRSWLAHGIRVPAPADELVMLLLMYARDGLAGVRFPLDVAAWYRRHGPGALVAVDPMLRRHGALQRPVLAAALAVDRLLGLDLGARIGPRQQPPAGTVAALRLQDWAQLLGPQYADVAVKIVDGLLTQPRGQPGWLARVVLPRLPPSSRPAAIDQALYVLHFVGRATPIYTRLLSGSSVVALVGEPLRQHAR